MISYWKDTKQRKTYKVDTTSEKDEAYIYWVQVHMFDDGAFVHARGRDVVQGKYKAKEILEVTAAPSTEKEYISSLKDYFAIDKKVRGQFIKQYEL